MSFINRFQTPPCSPCMKSNGTSKPALMWTAHPHCWQEWRGTQIHSPHPYPTFCHRSASPCTERDVQFLGMKQRDLLGARPGSWGLCSGFNKVAISNTSFCPQNSSSSSTRFIKRSHKSFHATGQKSPTFLLVLINRFIIGSRHGSLCVYFSQDFLPFPCSWHSLASSPCYFSRLAYCFDFNWIVFPLVLLHGYYL